MAVCWVISSLYSKVERLQTLHDSLFPMLGPKDKVVYSGNYAGYHPEVSETFEELMQTRSNETIFLKGYVEKAIATFEHIHLQHKPEVWLTTLDPLLFDPILAHYGFSFDYLVDVARKGAVSLARFSNDFQQVLRTTRHGEFLHNLKKNCPMPVEDSIPGKTPAGLLRTENGFTLNSGRDLDDPIYAISVDLDTGEALQMIEV